MHSSLYMSCAQLLLLRLTLLWFIFPISALHSWFVYASKVTPRDYGCRGFAGHLPTLDSASEERDAK